MVRPAPSSRATSLPVAVGSALGRQGPDPQLAAGRTVPSRSDQGHQEAKGCQTCPSGPESRGSLVRGRDGRPSLGARSQGAQSSPAGSGGSSVLSSWTEARSTPLLGAEPFITGRVTWRRHFPHESPAFLRSQDPRCSDPRYRRAGAAAEMGCSKQQSSLCLNGGVSLCPPPWSSRTA